MRDFTAAHNTSRDVERSDQDLILTKRAAKFNADAVEFLR